MANPVRPNFFIDGETVDALRQNEDLNTIYDWASTEAMHRDGSKDFTALPSGPGGGVLPTTDAQIANKLYVDSTGGGIHAFLTGGQDVSGSISDLGQLFGFAKAGAASNATAATGGLTLNAEGLWIVASTVEWETNVNGKRRSHIYKNGVATGVGKIELADYATTFEGFAQTLLAPLVVTATGTTVSLWVAQDSGVTLDVNHATLNAWKVA